MLMQKRIRHSVINILFFPDYLFSTPGCTYTKVYNSTTMKFEIAKIKRDLNLVNGNNMFENISQKRFLVNTRTLFDSRPPAVHHQNNNRFFFFGNPFKN